MNIILASKEEAKFIAALEYALATKALGQNPRLFLQGEAAALLALPLVGEQDHARAAAGLPALAEILEEAAACEIEIIACQTGLYLGGISAENIWPQAKIGGLISFLSSDQTIAAVY